MTRRLLSLLSVSLVVAASALAAVPETVIGLHVRPEADPAAREGLWERCTRMAVTDIFVQTFHEGVTIYPSNAERTFPQRADLSGTDLLQTYIDEGHAHGLRVHAWVDTLLWGPDRSAADEDGPLLIAAEHPEWQVADAQGQTTGPLFVSPAVPEVSNRATLLCLEIAHQHRDLDGLHLDYLRYPGGGDFSFDRSALAAFEAQGQPDPRESSSETVARAWRSFVESKPRDLANQIGIIMEGLYHGDVLFSVAVQPVVEEGDLTYQNWPAWLEEGHIDAVVPQCYATDVESLRAQVRAASEAAGTTPCWVALAHRSAPGSLSVSDLLGATAGFDGGTVWFSDVSLAGAPDAMNAIGQWSRARLASPEAE